MLISNKDNANQFEMFISINLNEDKGELNTSFTEETIYYYYPNNSTEISEDLSVYPIEPSNSLKFFFDNKDKYQQIACNVKFLIAFNGEMTAFKTSIANYVKIINKCMSSNHEDYISQTALITSYSLIKLKNVNTDEDLEHIQIFTINIDGLLDNENNNKIQDLLKKAEFITSERLTLNEKNSYLNYLQREFNLIKLEKNNEMMKHRAQFIKYVENSKYEYLFKDPITNNIVTPVLDVLFINYNFFNSQNEPITIELNEIENNYPQFCDITFITYHIPKQTSFMKFTKSLKIRNKKEEKISIENKMTRNYKNFVKNSEFAKNCCLFYEKSANFGKINGSILNSNLLVGYFNFNTHSTGTIIFNRNFIPIGFAYFNSVEFYSIKKFSQNYNLIIPFNHFGIHFLFKKFLNEPLSVEEFLKDKQIKLKNYPKPIDKIKRNMHNKKFIGKKRK